MFIWDNKALKEKIENVLSIEENNVLIQTKIISSYLSQQIEPIARSYGTKKKSGIQGFKFI